MKDGVMLYREGGEDKVWGYNMETIVVPKSDLKKYLMDGWENDPNVIIQFLKGEEEAEAADLSQIDGDSDDHGDDLTDEEKAAIQQSNEAGATVPENNNGNPQIETADASEDKPATKEPKTKTAKKSS